jgi:MFS family permease
VNREPAAAQRTPAGRSLPADAGRILIVQALRAFAYGLGSVLIGVMLSREGLSGPQVGVVLGALLAGSAVVSLALARFGDRIGRRRWYLGLLVAMGVAGTVFALTGSVPLLVLAALTGTVSTEVVESGPFTSLEQAMLPSAARELDVTRLFGTYNTIATLAGSAGALAAVGSRVLHVEPQHLLLTYPLAAAAALVVARGMTPVVEASAEPRFEPTRPLGPSRGRVLGSAASLRSTRSAEVSSPKRSWPTGSRNAGRRLPRYWASSSFASASSRPVRSRSRLASPDGLGC